MSIHETQFKKLTEIGSIGRGKSKHRPRNDPDLYDGPYPFIQTGDIKRANFYVTTFSQTYSEKGLSQSKLWEPDTLCITIAANIAETAILKIHACFPDSIIGFIPKKNISDVKFIKYCLDTYKKELQLISQGTTQDNLSQEKLLSLKLRVPSYGEQQKIAATLSAYDDLIENNQRRIALLDKMAEEIYREWFVRLRFPGHKRSNFNKGVPDSWIVSRFGSFCRLKRGYDLPDSQIVNGVYPVIASTTIKALHTEWRVNSPVITTGRSGSLGKVMWVNSKSWPLNTSLYVQDFCGNSPYLIYYTLKNMGLENFNAGAGVPTLNRNHLNGIAIVVPSKKIQTQFDLQIEPIFAMKEKLANQNVALVKSRDLLLGRLISGKLSVESLDIKFPPSMQESADAS